MPDNKKYTEYQLLLVCDHVWCLAIDPPACRFWRCCIWRCFVTVRSKTLGLLNSVHILKPSVTEQLFDTYKGTKRLPEACQGRRKISKTSLSPVIVRFRNNKMSALVSNVTTDSFRFWLRYTTHGWFYDSNLAIQPHKKWPDTAPFCACFCFVLRCWASELNDVLSICLKDRMVYTILQGPHRSLCAFEMSMCWSKWT